MLIGEERLIRKKAGQCVFLQGLDTGPNHDKGDLIPIMAKASVLPRRQSGDLSEEVA